MGILPLAVHYGFDIVEQFLAGARDIDRHFASADLENNLPVLLGLVSFLYVKLKHTMACINNVYLHQDWRVELKLSQIPF